MPTMLTVGDLLVLLRECAGEEESVDLEGDILDVPFEDLGYDSLALLNTVGRIERDCSVRLGDDTVEKALTPRDLIDMTNSALGAGGSASAADEV
ncbi:acyl carrier protein [Streptomyces sp. NPDC050617]|uniref:acyl carrier protein n=1 Tax=Streptomyces sp. NPDC050617 TaxID=3154628 RepID=UPI00342008DD